VVKPGNPPYLEYVRSTVEQKRLNIPNVEPHEPQGNPDLVYVSQLVEGWEPSGVRVGAQLKTSSSMLWLIDTGCGGDYEMCGDTELMLITS
jgi:ethanolamine utilization protein EutQ (cupin superfamily)